MSAYAPKAHLGLGRHQLGPVLHQGRQGRAGRQLERRHSARGGASRKARSTSSRSPTRCRPRLKAKVDEVKAGLKDGSFAIWKGPIVGQDGKEVLAKDAVADDKCLGGVNFYVKGVEGKVPGDK